MLDVTEVPHLEPEGLPPHRDRRVPEEGVLRPPIRVHALRTEVLLNGYVPLPWPRGAVLAFSSAFGAAIPIARGEAIPPDRAFFLGGRNTLRGYYEQELIPDDVVQAYEALGKACAEAGPLDGKTRELVKLGMAVGGGVAVALGAKMMVRMGVGRISGKAAGRSTSPSVASAIHATTPTAAAEPSHKHPDVPNTSARRRGGRINEEERTPGPG